MEEIDDLSPENILMYHLKNFMLTNNIKNSIEDQYSVREFLSKELQPIVEPIKFESSSNIDSDGILNITIKVLDKPQNLNIEIKI